MATDSDHSRADYPLSAVITAEYAYLVCYIFAYR